MISTVVREIPMLFTAESIRAILDGTKTQTRRVVKPQPVKKVLGAPMSSDDWAWPFPYGTGCRISCKPNGPDGWADEYARWKRGDLLWVRETWMPVDLSFRTPGKYLMRQDDNGRKHAIVYRADADWHCDWKSGRFMPKWASRLWLEVTDVRVERLQGISEADAIAEGIRPQEGDGGGPGPGYKWKGTGYHGAGFHEHGGMTFHTPRTNGRCSCAVGDRTPAQCAYRELWDSINGKTHPWKSNPWVWVMKFKRIERSEGRFSTNIK